VKQDRMHGTHQGACAVGGPVVGKRQRLQGDLLWHEEPSALLASEVVVGGTGR
jgi:hypothetical protein